MSLFLSIPTSRRPGGFIFFTLFAGILASLTLSACTPQEDPNVEEDEWAEIEAIAEVVPAVSNTAVAAVDDGPIVGKVGEGEFAPFFQRLEKLQQAERKAGETLLTGKTLVLDYDRRYISMSDDVLIEDDEGSLSADTLTGRFSASNEVEFIEAEGDVELTGSNRTARADHTIYNHRSGFIKLEGMASATVEGNTLSGERIQLWVRDNRRMICEPNALLRITSTAGLEFEGVSGGSNLVTEIRADKAMYNEAAGTAELIGNVRVRDERAAMNCEKLRLFLKDTNEIDWIEAVGGVIIQAEDRRALAARATYHADEGKFTLEGEPKVKQGLHVMTGDRILFWPEERRMVCEPNARVLLYLDEETKAKFLKDLDE
ncbi:LptA/OstA family protein [Pontiella sp.]|uniref:LptA/OstA family protein n=1 Tax=Pontiella sp. TaxID=2837462 RepID=UPI0035621790